jgi:3-deoxy-manno-octulosonate cytidylyltransferase (CMP-KDO synthetase)
MVQVSVKTLVVIPARFASTRFPGKPLALLGGKPILQWVYEKASQVGSGSGVLVATDDHRIRDCVLGFGGRVEMTKETHLSGTERIAEVAQRSDAGIFVNVQGDEPFIEPQSIAATLDLVASGAYEMASAITQLANPEELEDPNVVKAVIDRHGRALYFSRFPIPYSRSRAPESMQQSAAYRHLGLYVYRRDTLLTLANLPASALELGESLEQLRALENGISIGLARVKSDAFGIDTPGDLAKAEAYLRSRQT